MKFIPYRAFGLLFTRNEHSAGDVYKSVVNDKPRCTTYCVKGLQKSLNLDTNEPAPDYGKGKLLYPHDYTLGTFSMTVVEDTVIYCYDPDMNFGKNTPLYNLEVPAGSSVTLAVGTKYILCEGTVVINENTYTAPARLSIESESKTLCANVDTYLLRVGI